MIDTRGQTPYIKQLLHTLREHPELRADTGNKAGGAPHGERNGRAILTETQVRQIRFLYDSCGLTVCAIVKRVGIGYSVIYQIVKRVTWQHVKGY